MTEEVPRSGQYPSSLPKVSVKKQKKQIILSQSMVIDMDPNKVCHYCDHYARRSYAPTEKRPSRNCDTASRPNPQPYNHFPFRVALDRYCGTVHRGHAPGVDALNRALWTDAGRGVRDADQRHRGPQSVPVVLPGAAGGAAPCRNGYRATRAGTPTRRGGALL